jgi:uncharacterized protein (TIGR03437 family)
MSKLATRLGLAAAVATAVLVAAAASSLAVTAKPSITKFTPSTAKPGAMVTITGTDLTGVKAVEFNGLKATFKAVSATKVTATVPSKAKSGKITVVTKAGTAVSSTMLKV